MLEAILFEFFTIPDEELLLDEEDHVDETIPSTEVPIDDDIDVGLVFARKRLESQEPPTTTAQKGILFYLLQHLTYLLPFTAVNTYSSINLLRLVRT